ncbi:hypothetical protein [Gordonia sp. (in: high G+C Gram-positive bacteria)]|uniref:hypothetical protein n=1 Tax=Gordonia sp. (in: high G+C Gram-positive bacteria) TaxID=84139 RepID=UPI003C794573
MSHNPAVSRRKFFAVAAGLGAAALGAAESAPAVAGPGIPVPPSPAPLPDLPPVLDASPANFASPPLRRFVTELPRIPTRDAGGTLTAQTSVHRYHPDLPATPVLVTTTAFWVRHCRPGRDSRRRSCSATRSVIIPSPAPST